MNEIINCLENENVWWEYLTYKSEKNMPKYRQKELEAFIRSKKYLGICKNIRLGYNFQPPIKKKISKIASKKKRIVYTYAEEENYVLKVMTYLLIKKYNPSFAPNLFSFRPGYGAKQAIKSLSQTHGIDEMYSYKIDVHNYFNSVDLNLLMPKLKNILVDEEIIFDFLEKLLKDSRVYDGENIVEEEKGIMAGTPISVFLANLFLSDLDYYFREKSVLYARYSDDIILFAKTREEINTYKDQLYNYLQSLHLTLNPEKIKESNPGQKWEFLGFSYENGIVDISEVSLHKMKRKMRRKTRALMRWKKRKKVDGYKTARVFCRILNRKWYENESLHNLTWTRWYFPVINTDKTLREIDHYAQDCIRYLVSGSRSKKRFQVKYEEIKVLGYRSLLHEYYLTQEESRES